GKSEFYYFFVIPCIFFPFLRLLFLPFYQQPSSLPFITNHSPHSLNLKPINHVKTQARGPSGLVHERCQTHLASQLHFCRSQGLRPSPPWVYLQGRMTPKPRTKQVDYEKLAHIGGYKSASSAGVMYRNAKRKLSEYDPGNTGMTNTPDGTQANTPKETPNKRK